MSILRELGVAIPDTHGRNDLTIGIGFTESRNPTLAPRTTAEIGITRPCIAGLYVDGIPASADQLKVYNPEHIRAVESYPGRMLVPFGFSQGTDCGVVLVWTKNAKW